jgi:hypothetical protein
MGQQDQDRRRNERGQYTGKYSDDEFLEAISKADGFAGTGDVRDAVGCSHETAYKTLSGLANDGVIDSQKVGNARVWYLND